MIAVSTGAAMAASPGPDADSHPAETGVCEWDGWRRGGGGGEFCIGGRHLPSWFCACGRVVKTQSPKEAKDNASEDMFGDF